ncbi:MAG: GIY-YIG nuclease family protein [Bacteroidetes bacterium]|nr:GIY-YIG nuclease family protein [Bacteroidota bacterium]MBK8362907.1 GIY-YIG nuclease family protein [Bacteroidota bacterium]MBK9413742.1 GIY-YIG nuclease family protein [Bacteroidota bacterium]MBL0032890.1 GIY-YIG nuclease family protein [Bacteroidota bacterium]MBP6657512.1 GIY-YIG nuclease family protein [Bacteroidia bacterium]
MENNLFTTYVLYSEKFNKHYTGSTSDFQKRLLSHQELGNKDWTTKYRPWKVIFTKEFTNKSDAMKLEKWLKTGVGRDFIKQLPH